ncbi:MAG: hypothetical protein GTO17_00690 [Candidatus Aminicenantes bacterium]|nr:hypothetical protein [Candidatus Aminicenantes bacterium]
MKGGNRTLLKCTLLFILFAVIIIFTSLLQAEDEKFEDNQKFSEDSKEKNNTVKAESSDLSASKSFIILKQFRLAKEKDRDSRKRSNLVQNKNFSLSNLPKYSLEPNKFKKVEKSLYTTSLITLIALSTADYFTTIKASQYKELKEINPIMKPLVKNPSLYLVLKLGVNAYVYYAMQKLYKKNKKLAWLVSVLANAAFSYIVLNNIWHINEVK